MPGNSSVTCSGMCDDATPPLSRHAGAVGGYAARFDDLFGSLAQRPGSGSTWRAAGAAGPEQVPSGSWTAWCSGHLKEQSYGPAVPVPADEDAEDGVEVTGGEDADCVGKGACVEGADCVGDGACVEGADCVGDGDGDRVGDSVAEPDGDGEADGDADGDCAEEGDCVGEGSRVSKGDCVSKGVSSVVAGVVPKATGAFERADGMDLDDGTDVDAGAVAAAGWAVGPPCVEA